jgi:hypothetical protein
MDAHEELILRVADKRRRKLGLSKNAYAELLLAVRKDPEKFIDDDQEEAFLHVVKAIDRYMDKSRVDDMLTDEEYLAERTRRYAQLASDCSAALAIDDACEDARLIFEIAKDDDPDALLDRLIDIQQDVERASVGYASESRLDAVDAWDDVFSRPYLRLQDSIARAYLETARYRLALAAGQRLLAISPSDVQGARHTCALALARLEDEAGFDELDAQHGRHGDTWSHLARVILLFKLGRLSAARRALAGYDRLCEGGSYALLRPVLVEPYVPDRPACAPCSFAEAMLAVHEADPIVVDTPDLPAWAEAQPGILESAQAFAQKSGFEW